MRVCRIEGYELLQCEHAPLIEGARMLEQDAVGEVLVILDGGEEASV